MSSRLSLLFVLLLCINFSGLKAQEEQRIKNLEIMLDSLALNIPGLHEKTTISLRDVSLAEYLRAIGLQHAVNLYIPETPNQVITHNLSDEPVKTVLLFVCKSFSYTVESTGNILEFKPYIPPTVEARPEVKPLNISYKEGLLTLDLKNDSLYKVIRRISELSGIKIVSRPGLSGMISAYLPPTPLDTALEALFLSNGFELNLRKKGYYVLGNALPDPATPLRDRLSFEVESFTDGKDQYISTHAENVDISELIKAIFASAQADYLIYDKIEGMISISADIAQLEEVLRVTLQGTDFTYKKEGNLFLIGSKDLEGLQSIKTVRMHHRPTFQAIELIPGAEGGSSTSGQQTSNTNRNQTNIPRQNLNNTRYQNRNQFNSNQPYNNSAYNSGYNSGGGYGGFATQTAMSISAPPQIYKTKAGEVEIIDYPELNRIILKGPTDRVEEIASFLHEIDRPVPMVKVEMLVVEVNKNRLLSTGIRAGLRASGDSTAGGAKDVLPGVDYNLSGSDLNAIFGTVPALSNLGTLSSRFYLQLKAQETRGNLKVKMQPVLSMLNGREASLQIGQSQYYLLETQTSSNGAVNNFQTFTQRFERIDANISLSIKPYISDDDMVTLDVMPDFTTPVGQFSSETPPTISTRRFVSTIRVKNGETVILGGLSEESMNETTSGLPWLSRVPVLKWIFGNNNKSKAKSSLIIYITPVIYYN